MAEVVVANRIRPKTYSFAVYLVIGVLLIQLAALASVFWFRHRVVEVEVNAPLAPSTEQAPAVAPVPLVLPTPAEAPRLNPGSPRLNMSESLDPAQRVAVLNDEAIRFRQQGDFQLAGAALDEAEKLDVKNTTTLTNQAQLAEAMTQWERAKTYWQRIVNGADPGANAAMLARERLVMLSQMETAKPTPNPATAGRRLFIDDIARSGADDFTLRIRIGASSSAEAVEPGRVGVKLYFFDKLANGQVVPSSVRVRVQFEGVRQTWTNNAPEVLVADFQGSTRPSVELGRVYYGYLLRIYYKGNLQDERAEPRELLQMYPNS